MPKVFEAPTGQMHTENLHKCRRRMPVNIGGNPKGTAQPK